MTNTNKLTDDLYTALKRQEYAGNNLDGNGPFCICCGMQETSMTKHRSDCVTGNALAQYELVKKAEDLLKPVSSK